MYHMIDDGIFPPSSQKFNQIIVKDFALLLPIIHLAVLTRAKNELQHVFKLKEILLS